ncbi:uncharacterized protein LOC133366007 [Rhineura floridana]|uniref:uncharacterized protein LOC133366007 n=1 Tax=Rhineura floridana TaxID=261503 RepID=UPI002AC89455|nr:uncharacterized protein LOC133366007 [Rhineura floridana]
MEQSTLALLVAQIQVLNAVLELMIKQRRLLLQTLRRRKQRRSLQLKLIAQLRRRMLHGVRGGHTTIVTSLAASSYFHSIRRDRNLWVKQRTARWWEDEVLLQWDEPTWKEKFRMSKATLFHVAEQLKPHLERQDTVFREAIPLEKRVAIAVWWLSNAESYRQVATLFNVGRSTAGEIVREVCLAIEHYLLARVVTLGSYHKIMDGFEKMGFPHCIAAVGSCHIPIIAPMGQAADYINHKGFFSIHLQGATDHTGRFIDVEIGWSGKTHDAFVFMNSALCKAMDAGVFVPGNPTITLNGVQIPPLVLADAAYPMRTWLMKPYSDHLDERKMNYNIVFNRCHNVIERAFDRLKKRWRRISERVPVAEENLVSVVSACVVLHNVCESRGDFVEDIMEMREQVTVPPFSDNEQSGEQNAAQEEVRRSVSLYLQQRTCVINKY